jgi:gas vesicle protein
MLGSIVGVAVGLLIAPEEGRKVRRRVAYHLDRAYKRLNALLEMPSELEREARQTGRSLVKGAEEQANEILQDVDALINEVKRGGS